VFTKLFKGMAEGKERKRGGFFFMQMEKEKKRKDSVQKEGKTVK
jgi:hypothetical protein